MPVIFITGATSGFGAATARLFAQNGWQVVATGRRRERLQALQAEFPEGVVHIAQMDLTQRQSIVDAVAALPEGFRPVTCLFNNGGLALGTEPVPEVDLDDWETMIETNIKGLIHTTLELLPQLKAAGRGASIINTGSIAQRFAYPGGNVYGGTKAFVHQFSENLRADLAGTDIRVTSLEPGMSKTEFTLVRTHGDAAANEKMYEGVEPLQPEDLADIVWFLATRPPHVNIGQLEVMPVAQVPSRPSVVRK
ncbi:MAG TPA: SDR family NAD(P)-dependent oxidoreductase [Devosiaceae bacterium]|jgi:NADP-dependent 3-hydroxy acid dehydrogenase YdfG|nr:SDR family NAD(P)-dependent oxidoreductase [Devosiaceae bacterium]